MQQDLRKAAGAELVTASLSGSQPELGRGLHNSLAGDTAGWKQLIIVFDFSVCSAAFMRLGRQESDTLPSPVPSAEQTAPSRPPWPANEQLGHGSSLGQELRRSPVLT